MKKLSLINSSIEVLRLRQWLKNLLLFFPPFFAGTLFQAESLSRAVPAFCAFGCAASCCYILNDLIDREKDLLHPVKKKNRPIARGDMPVPAALSIALLLYAAAMLISVSLSLRFVGYLIIYMLLSFAYSLYFKRIVIADMFFIAFGFLLRVSAGGEAFGVHVSNWLFLSVFVVALFLATGKRVGEFITLGKDASRHRETLGEYPSFFLEGMLWFSGAAALVMYSLYTIENKNQLFYTVPVAAFGLIRYIFVLKKGQGDPTEVLLQDYQILATGFIWAFMVGIILYK